MDETNGTRGNAQAIIDTVGKLNEVDVICGLTEDWEQPWLVAVPEGKKVKDLSEYRDRYLDAPRRRTGTAVLHRLESLVGHVLRFKDEHSVIFADVNDAGSPQLVAVLNYHEQGHDGAPRFGDHRAVYRFPVSEEWSAWTGTDSEWMSQADFAAFLEERSVEVLDPKKAGDKTKDLIGALGLSLASPAQLVALSRGLSVRVNQRVENAQSLSSGEMSVQFKTEHQGDDGKPLKVPGAFLIGIPVFRNGDAYQVLARLRYRLHGGAVTWSYDLHRTDAIWDDAVTEACQRVTEETEVPLVYGTPEG